MERVDLDFTRYWGELRAELTAQLNRWTLVFFRDLPAPDAQTIEGLIRGGKKLRGCMVLAVCDALGGPIGSALPTAVAIECVHAASLIHDDLVDGDRTRRDRPATWIVHGSRRAVLLGDLIFATALQRSAELGREEVLTLSRAVAMVAAGAYKESLDMREIETVLPRDTLARPLYERIIYLKTGALFAAAAQLGAIAAQATPLLREAAFEFGARMGEAYQIADDLEDVVNGAGARMMSPSQLATLASVLAYFDVPTNGLAPISGINLLDRLDRSVEQLALAMEAEIGRRIALARQALAPFPERPHLALLHTLPAAIVEPKVAAAKRARRTDVVVADSERR